LARGDPNVQYGIGGPSPGGIITTPFSGRGGPQVPYGIGGAGYAFDQNSGSAAHGLVQDLLLRKRLLEQQGVARYPGKPRPDIGGNPPTTNIYKGIPGFENYTGGPRIGGDALGWWSRHMAVPGQGGYPTRERVSEISDAMGRLGQGGVLPRTQRQGYGAGTEDYSDILKRLLMERGGM
jgi:hypothetical protein